MLCTTRALVCMTLASALLSGCNYDLDFSDLDLFGESLFQPRPGLGDVPPRLALNASAMAVFRGHSAEARVTVADPQVLIIERVDSAQLEISAIGVGETTIVFENHGKTTEYPVEVAKHERHEVWLAAHDSWTGGPIPLVEIDGKSLLANTPQQLLVTYYDAHGLLYGSGLVELSPPLRSEQCRRELGGPFDTICIAFDPGLHVLELGLSEEKETMVIGASTEEEIIDLEVLQADEALAQAGEILVVGAVGLTEQGTQVHGIGAEFVSTPLPTSGLFAYEYVPGEATAITPVRALGFEKEASYRGRMTLPDSLWHSCKNYWFNGC